MTSLSSETNNDLSGLYNRSDIQITITIVIVIIIVVITNN